MKNGDTVIVISDCDDQNAQGVIAGEGKIEIGRRVRVFKIVRFDGRPDGAFEEWELQIVEPRNVP